MQRRTSYRQILGLGTVSSRREKMIPSRPRGLQPGSDQDVGRGEAATTAPPLGSEPPPLEAPYRMRVFARFGFTRAKKYVDFGPYVKGKKFGRLTPEKSKMQTKCLPIQACVMVRTGSWYIETFR